MLVRFMQVDPLATMYAPVSGYHYGGNNPVMMNDPTGAASTGGCDCGWLNPETSNEEWIAATTPEGAMSPEFEEFMELTHAFYNYAQQQRDEAARQTPIAVTVNGIYLEMNFHNTDEMLDFVHKAVLNTADVMKTMISGGGIQIMIWYRDENGAPTTVDGAAAIGTFIGGGAVVTARQSGAMARQSQGAQQGGLLMAGWEGDDDGDHLRGGKKKDRDRTLQQYPKEFQRWYHKDYKQKNNPGQDSSPEELKEIFEDWKDLGEPTVKIIVPDPWYVPSGETMKNVITGGLIIGGAAIIIFDIITIPSGEGLIGVQMIGAALAK